MTDTITKTSAAAKVAWSDELDRERPPRRSGLQRSYYHELFEQAPSGYFVLAQDGLLLHANDTAAALMGAAKVELIGQQFARFIGATGALEAHLQDVLSCDVARACEVDIIPPSRPRFRAHLDSIAARDEHGTIVEVRTVLSPRPRDRDAWFGDIADHIEDVLYVRERDGRFSYVSQACELLWGRTALELVTTPAAWTESIHPQDRDNVMQAHKRFRQGDPFDEEYRLVRRDGAERWVRDRAFPQAGADGESGRVIGILQDITGTRALETELWQAQKMEAVGALASGISHDFRNLLQAILGCATAALRAETVDASRTYWARVLDAVRRGSDLIGHLMTFSRKEPVVPRATLIDAAVQGSAKLLGPLVGDHIKLLIGAGAPAAVVMADPVQIEQILMNLAANARDAMPDGGTLTIWTETTRGSSGQSRIRLLIRDTGGGMDEETMAHMFEPFFTTKRAGAGTGLGLATVLGIIHSMRGEIRVESELGKGTTFVITLPCAGRPQPDPTSQKRLSSLHASVLLVEDEPLVRTTLRHFIEELGLQVEDVADPREALDVASEVDLLISDVSLPGMMGPQLAKRLRERFPALRALFISGQSQSELVMSGTLPADAAYLGKPFTIEELGAAITGILRCEN